MKLNPDCLLAVLKAYEKMPYPSKQINLEIPGYSIEDIYYHELILRDAGFILVSFDPTGDEPYLHFPDRLTFKGHEFLNAAENKQAWAKVKKFFEESGGFVLSIAQALLLDYLKKTYLGQ